MQRRNRSPVSTLWPCSHTQYLIHSNHLLILLWTDFSEHLYFLLTQVLWRAVWLMRWWMYSGKVPYSVHLSLWLMRNHFWPQILPVLVRLNDKRLSFPIMLNAVLQMAVKGRYVSFIRPTVYVSAFYPQAFFHHRQFQIYCSVLQRRIPPPLSLLFIFLICNILCIMLHFY